jgi:replicative DNA helicase
MSAKNIGDRINPDAAKNIKAAAAEEAILGLMLMFDEHRAAAANGSAGISKEDFYTEFGGRVFEAIVELEKSDGGYMYSLLGEHFTPDEMGRMQGMEYKRRQLVSNGKDVFCASIAALKEANNQAETKSDWISDISRRKELLKSKKK